MFQRTIVFAEAASASNMLQQGPCKFFGNVSKAAKGFRGENDSAGGFVKLRYRAHLPPGHRSTVEDLNKVLLGLKLATKCLYQVLTGLGHF